MPPWGQVLGAQGVDEVVAYVQQLSGQQPDATLAAAGQTQFETVCAACHGVDGKGNPLLGAPNLTDAIWLYGGDAATIKQTVENGRNGQMPAFGDRLGAERVRLLAAYAITPVGDAASSHADMFGAAIGRSTPASCDGHASGRTWPSCSGRRSSPRASRRWSASRSSTRC